MSLLINNYGMFSLLHSIVGNHWLAMLFMVCEIVVNWTSKQNPSILIEDHWAIYTHRSFLKHCPKGGKERYYSLFEITLLFEEQVVYFAVLIIVLGSNMPSNPAKHNLGMSVV